MAFATHLPLGEALRAIAAYQKAFNLSHYPIGAVTLSLLAVSDIGECAEEYLELFGVEMVEGLRVEVKA